MNRIMNPGEVIVWQGSPHLFACLIDSLKYPLLATVVAFCVFLPIYFLFAKNGGSILIMALAQFGFFILIFWGYGFYKAFSAYSTKYIVTNERILNASSLSDIGQTSDVVKYSEITDVQVTKTLGDKLSGGGIATVLISTPFSFIDYHPRYAWNTRVQAPYKFRSIKNAAEVLKIIQTQKAGK